VCGFIILLQVILLKYYLIPLGRSTSCGNYPFIEPTINPFGNISGKIEKPAS
jgi:hypothetical protein